MRTVDSKGTPTSALNKAMVPEVYYDGEWHPICGHYFWNNNNGAAAVCKKLGYAVGFLGKTNAKYAKDAMPVGGCANSGQALTSCTGGANAWGIFDYNRGGSLCTKGQSVGITVRCAGGSGQKSASCAAATTGQAVGTTPHHTCRRQRGIPAITLSPGLCCQPLSFRRHRLS